MLLSKLYAPTLKEDPAEAEVISHRLLLRAGMIRRLTSGIYTYLPLGLRALNKVADIVRREMNASGAQEILMPMVLPSELWQETGRWEKYGKELLRFIDRHERGYCLGPTHEEIVTDLVRHEVRSYRQLPLNLYQIQTKFRDEIRPRFGLMRGREFVMKDGYSFDRDEEGANATYQEMYDAYCRIFKALGLRFRAVEADSGQIGGSFSHEFMVLAETGEDVIAACPACAYGANLEKAPVVHPEFTDLAAPAETELVSTPGQHTVEEVARFLKLEAHNILKTLIFKADGKLVAVLLRGDRELNEVKLQNLLGADKLELASPAEVEAASDAPVGFAGPMGLKVEAIYADLGLKLGTDYVCGANCADTHVLHLHLPRDVKVEGYADLAAVAEGDPCPKCGAKLELTRGIEVGHVFKLGQKYSEAMRATFLDENGKEQVTVMGCYGIGVSRIVAACIEQNFDGDGIIFPPSVAPFEVAVIDMGGKDPAVSAKAREIYDYLIGQGLDALLDERDERPGVKFKEADLMGHPMRLVVGGKGLAKGIVEARDRKSGELSELPIEGFAQAFAAWREKIRASWGLA